LKKNILTFSSYAFYSNLFSKKGTGSVIDILRHGLDERIIVARFATAKSNFYLFGDSKNFSGAQPASFATDSGKAAGI
jgi:hypothetical protein